MRNSNHHLICVLTAGVVLLWDTRPELLNPLSESTPSPFERFPYAVLQKANTRHNADGSLSYEFDAAKVEHFRADLERSSTEDYMLLSTPQLTLYGEPFPWYVSAKHGKVSAKGDKLELWDEVIVWQAHNRTTQGHTQLTTAHITVLPSRKQLLTDAPVTINAPSGNISAMAEVDMLTQRIKLLAEVRGTHDPIH